MTDAIIVVGAGGDIGLACARAVAAPGELVVCVDRDPASASRSADALRHSSVDAQALAADATDPDLPERIVALLGGRGVRALIHAVAYEQHRSADDLGADSVRRSLETGPVAAYELARRLKAAGLLGRGSTLVMIGSLHAQHAFRGTLGYNLAQAATASLVQSLAHEWAADGVRVNEAVPGWTKTAGEVELYGAEELERRQALLPLQRAGDPRDVAEAVAFLCSDAAAYISGARLVVDGALGASLAVLPGGDR